MRRKPLSTKRLRVSGFLGLGGFAGSSGLGFQGLRFFGFGGFEGSSVWDCWGSGAFGLFGVFRGFRVSESGGLRVVGFKGFLFLFGFLGFGVLGLRV